MEDHELEALLDDLESDRAERKASASDSGKIRATICAFANDLPHHGKPGVLFVGVQDKGGCADLPITDELLRRLADTRNDGSITPFPSLTVAKKTIRGCEMAVVVVEPSTSPPVMHSGRIHVRVGPTTTVATRQDEERLVERRRSHELPFDIRPVSGASLDDLDLDLFRTTYLPSSVSAEILDANERSVEQQLASLRMVSRTDHAVPTLTGMLVLGKEPRRALPAAYVQFIRFDGRDLACPIKDQKEIDGPLSEVMRTLDEIFRAHVSVSSRITDGPVEIRHPSLPLAALQQVARNAVLHRTYESTNAPVRIYWFEDRVEVFSPGGPFGQVTTRNFGTPGLTDYRNPHLAEAMKNLGYVQRFGVGLAIVRRELEKNANPEPEFVAQDHHVLVTLRTLP